MDIFDNMAQAVRFAFCLEAYREAGGALVLVQMALRDAGVKGAQEARPEQLAALRTQARTVTLALHADLLPMESSFLIARYSRNAGEKRAAIKQVCKYFHRTLSYLIANWSVVDKLVERRYVGATARHGEWDLGSIETEFNVSVARLTKASKIIERSVRELEALALNSLRDALGLPEAKQAALQGQEVAHA